MAPFIRKDVSWCNFIRLSTRLSFFLLYFCLSVCAYSSVALTFFSKSLDTDKSPNQGQALDDEKMGENDKDRMRKRAKTSEKKGGRLCAVWYMERKYST